MNRGLIIGFGLSIVAFVGIGSFLERNAFHELLRLMQFPIAISALIIYGVVAWKAFTATDDLRMIRQISLGICIGFLHLALAAAWALLWRLGGKPDWMYTSWMSAFLIFLTLQQGLLHVFAPRVFHGMIPRITWIMTAASLGLAIFVFLMIGRLQPDLSRVIIYLEKLLEN